MTITDNQMNTELQETATSSHRVATPRLLTVSRTRTIDEVLQGARDLVEVTGYYRNVTDVVSGDLAEIHHRAFAIQLETRTTKLGRRSPSELLDELATLGFSWGDLARMIGVTVPAMRRWRLGESPTGTHRRDIAQLVAFVEILQEDHLVDGVATWMEIPIHSSSPITAIDLYISRKTDLLFDLASDHLDSETVLTEFEPDWRTRNNSDFDIFTAGDESPSIRLSNQNHR